MSGGAGTDIALGREQERIAHAGARYLIGYVALSSALYSVVDIYYFDSDVLDFLSAMFVWALGFALLVVLMQVSAPEPERAMSGIGGYIALGILTSIPIFVGFVFLIVPGLYLLMRWLPAFARLYAQGEGVFEALGWSWRSTAPFQKQLSLALLGPLAGYGVIVGIAVLQEINLVEWSNSMLEASSVVVNLAVAIADAWLQLLGVAAYRAIRRSDDGPVDVFI